MKVLRDAKKNKAAICSSIKKFGFSAEHNYQHYICKQAPSRKCVFFDFGQKKGIMALFNGHSKTWHVLADILAPQEEQLAIFMKFLDYALTKKKSKKITAEFSEGFKQQVFSRLRNSKYRAAVNYELYWPVYDLQSWDERLAGKQWKKLRNINNRFMNHSKVRIQNPRKISKNALRSILLQWLRKRSSTDRVDLAYYLNIIDNNFRGFDMAKVISIDGEPCAVSAGWKIPNTDCFYCAVGLSNYSRKDLWDFANLNDLTYLKKAGCRHVDLGGSDRALLSAKSKFRPAKVYKTCIFSVTNKV